ncbi:DUF799 domain-containing protein [Ralstonia pseudosolanacearum]|uniref:DUF799 domain-containing protein n=1 Tax=Ralstonia pseudosolanacearum TaxID=1310165 RepID=UPI0018D16D86|nr:DUF799 domain-containing protein [Ralstonia pseudosolanacearum]UWD88457.1 DUF799 domain-containing protein [Ralstonia pseudosolanacearum]CAH0441533.1 Putative lipoprotein/NMB1162 [Ralstonia pseudosolanacearum]
MAKRFLKLFAAIGVVALMAGCATRAKHVDYAAFKASKPHSIVVLPPLNQSPDVKATYGMLSQVTMPLAEAGYYVLPVALVDETFRQNGLTTAGDIHGVPVAKLRDIFGADAALYVTIKQYGTKYMLIDSVTVVAADAKLVDLKSGETLWTGHASASSKETGNSVDVNAGGIIGVLVSAAVKQIVNTAIDSGYSVAGATSARLLSAGQHGGLLYGPRSPKYGTD